MKHVGDYLYLEQEQLTLITDKSHPLYDPRVEIEPSPEFVENIRANGIQVPVMAWEDNNGHLVVAAGRQRVKAARILWETKGIRVPVRCIVVSGNYETLASLAVIENEARRDDGIMVKAAKAQKLIDMGMAVKDVATTFCVSRQAINQWQRALNLSEYLKGRVESGGLSVTAALDIDAAQRKGMAALRKWEGEDAEAATDEDEAMEKAIAEGDPDNQPADEPPADDDDDDEGDDIKKTSKAPKGQEEAPPEPTETQETPTPKSFKEMAGLLAEIHLLRTKAPYPWQLERLENIKRAVDWCAGRLDKPAKGLFNYILEGGKNG